jgi:acyl transferase domain-containing protein
MNTIWGGFLKEIDKFDAAFFNILPREAEQMDPQQRLLLELAWEALEDSGQIPERLAGTRTGVFIGISGSDYGSLLMNNPTLVEAYAVPGNALSMAANRLSYIFDLRGPSLAIDTACSSSLVAAHLACESLWAGECSLALIGGVNMILSPSVTISFAHGMATSSDGRCKAFDAGANGMVRSEGGGLVVLKPLSKALADGDRIYALIRGSAINQDGKTNGITSPSRFAQEAVLRQAYHNASVSPSEVQYVETHGTGTLLGDPIEAQALGSVLGEGRRKDRPCAIGSVKTNLGHLEAAAGIASLIKVALSLKHGMIPPSLHFHEPNPHIPFEKLSLRVQESLASWPDSSAPRVAGVSAFGFGGVNAHIVLEELRTDAGSRQVDKESPADAINLLTLSARTPDALRSLARSYKDLLANGSPTPSIFDICYNASTRRTGHPHRLAIAARTREEFSERLDAFIGGESRRHMASGPALPGSRPKVVFVFSGYGSQWWAMGRNLIRHEPVFNSALTECDELLREYAAWSLSEVLLADESCSRLGGDNIEITQVALFAIQVSLAELWRSWGIEPDAVVGHSMGEVPAAYVSGALSLKDSLRVCFNRARLMQNRVPYESGHGAMAAAELSLEEARKVIEGCENCLAIAAHNSPGSVVLSGEATTLDNIIKGLRKRKIFCRVLRAPGAGHSPQVEGLRHELVKALEGLEPGPSSIPIFSTVTGQQIDGQRLGAEYWGRNIRETVYFAEAIDNAIDIGCNAFLELSPHPILAMPLSQCLLSRNLEGTILPSLKRNEDDRLTMLGSLGALYVSGSSVQWDKVYQSRGQYVDLPLYPWQRESYWLETGEGRGFDIERMRKTRHHGSYHPFLGKHLASAHSSGPHFWELELDERFFSYLEDHKVSGAVLLPGTAYIEMALAAAFEVFGAGPFTLTGVEFQKALFLAHGSRRTIQVILSPETKAEASFHIYSSSAGAGPANSAWVLNARGRVRREDAEAGDCRSCAIEELQSRLSEEIEGLDYYRQLRMGGLDYGPQFQGIERIRRCDGEALGSLRVPDAVAEDLDQYHYHPALLDACLQVLGAAVPSHLVNGDKGVAGLPTRMEQVRIYGSPGRSIWSHAHFRPSENGRSGNLQGDIRLYDTNGRLLAEVLGFRLQLFDSITQPLLEDDPEEWLYELQWQRKDRAEESSACESPSQLKGSWLIFEDGGGAGQALAEHLKEIGERPVLIRAGETYEAINPDRFQVRIDRPEDLRQLLDESLLPDHPPCLGVIHMWGLNSVPATELDLISIERAQAAGCASALNLVQELSRRKWGKPPRLWLVTREGQPVEASSVSGLAQSTLWGFGRTLAQEHSDLWGGLIDLDGNSQPQEIAPLILEEIMTADAEDQLAFRSGRRYVARLVRMRELSERARALSPQANGTYLITGGLGDLGLVVARWLVERGARRLILLARTSLPPRAKWKEVERETRAGRQIAAVRALESLGASIHLASVDVGDESQLSSFLNRFEEEGYPPIRGIIHAAGVADLQAIEELDRIKLNAVLRSKVDGSWLMHRLTEGMPLDFFVLFSSFSSLLSSPRLGHYAAANAFMDALAHYRQSQGLPALSINWGAWGEIGMAMRFIDSGRLPLEGLRSFSPGQALEMLERLMGQDRAQVGVMRVDWARWRSLFPSFIESPLLSCIASEEAGTSAWQNEKEATASVIRESLFLSEPQTRKALIEDYLRDLVARSFRMPVAKISTEQPLNSMGIDSLTAIEVKRRVESDLGVIVPVVALLQGPSIAQLAELLLDELSNGAGSRSEIKPANDDCELAVVDQLSESQVDALLREILIEEQHHQSEGANS